MLQEKQEAEIRAEIQRILASPEFVNSGVLGPLLRAAVRGDKIAGPEARELRAKLIEYYAGPGTSDPVVIELSEDTHAVQIRITSTSSVAQGYQPSTGRKLFYFLLCLVALIGVWLFYFLAPKR